MEQRTAVIVTFIICLIATVITVTYLMVKHKKSRPEIILTVASAIMFLLVPYIIYIEPIYSSQSPTTTQPSVIITTTQPPTHPPTQPPNKENNIDNNDQQDDSVIKVDLLTQHEFTIVFNENYTKETYEFTAPRTGYYWFGCDITDGNYNYIITLYNSKNEEIMEANYNSSKHGNGMELERGETYRFTVSPTNNYPTAIIDVGVPTEDGVLIFD